MINIIKWSSIRFELGKMTKEEAGYMVGIAYIPVRYYRGFVSWQNEDSRLSKPRLWNFDEYYSALVHYSGIYQSEKEEKE